MRRFGYAEYDHNPVAKERKNVYPENSVVYAGVLHKSDGVFFLGYFIYSLGGVAQCVYEAHTDVDKDIVGCSISILLNNERAQETKKYLTIPVHDFGVLHWERGADGVQPTL